MDSPAYDMPFFEHKEEAVKKDALYFERMAEAVEQEAYEKGFSAGERAGLEMGEQKAAVLLDRINSIIRELEETKEIILSELEPQILELAVSIARKIIIEELTVSPDTVLRIVKEAIGKIERVGKITIKINPALSELFNRLKPELYEVYPDISFDIDPSVSATGPLIVGPVEEVVTDIDEQLNNIREDMGGGIVSA